MKKIKLFLMAVGITAGIATLDSCADKCKDVNCGTGTCSEGTCTCADDGYEGTNCETKMSEKFVGSFKGNEACVQLADYPATITASSSAANKIIISHLGTFECSGQPVTFDATVKAKDITIASQSFCNNGGTLSGTGSINDAGTTITITYTYTPTGGSAETCTATLVKQ